VATPAALVALDAADMNPLALLQRHCACDWGDVGDEDKAANDAALAHGGRLLSRYCANGAKVWVITEADRSATTILLPSDY
jgi:hypothetical protein